MTTRSKITMAMLIAAVLSGAMASAEARKLPPRIPHSPQTTLTCDTICGPPPPRCTKPHCIPR